MKKNSASHGRKKQATQADFGKLTLRKARDLVDKKPDDPGGWKILGELCANERNYEEAGVAYRKALELSGGDSILYMRLGQVLYKNGSLEEAVDLVKNAIELNNDCAESHYTLAHIYYGMDKCEVALPHADKACLMQPRNHIYLTTRSNILANLCRYDEAVDDLIMAASHAPEEYQIWNNLANLKKSSGKLDEAIENYRKAMKLLPSSVIPYSNLLTTLHYHPEYDSDKIGEMCRKWDALYTPKNVPDRPEPAQRRADKCIRIGMVSDGFRGHPVGRMITGALEAIDKNQLEFYLYSTNDAEDGLTARLKRVASQWMPVKHLSDEGFAQKVREDNIDVLIDLAGHNAGNRMLSMALEPAPILVKWVGGLINTTGISAIDYLISDVIETPAGSDGQYVEKLIRLPDDYICYDPPVGYAPKVGALPALKNRYITLGCFNNAIKLNPVLLKEWAALLDRLPGAMLFLKSHQYNNKELVMSLYQTMEEFGVHEGRIVVEGPSSHQELLEAYNKVDIALDSWPYSGGLTTCEALFMGVPVVTMPGPTFAGRHSSTHLVNAGMPELVSNSWEEYRERVIELASDLDSLATIRKHLRQVLLESPVCDARRFAGHFTDAVRAIWQRYCEGKPPAALTFNKEGKAWFEGDDEPVTIQYAPEQEDPGFNWKLPGKIVVIDNSAKLVRQDGFDSLRRLNAFGVVAFDPSSRVENPGQYQGSEDVQVFPHAVLGDGQPAILYACLDPALSSTLEPLPQEQQFVANPQGAKVLTQLPINTIALDNIEGLESLDWLILDHLSDAIAILEHGEKSLKETLLIQVRVAFQPTHNRQPNLAELQHWMSRNGFRFYCFNGLQHLSHLPESVPLEARQASELIAADVIFLPSHKRMDALCDEQRIKLSFLLHTVYGIKDFSYWLLAEVSEKMAGAYLHEETTLSTTRSTRTEIHPDRAKTQIPSPSQRKGSVSEDIDALLAVQPLAVELSSAEQKTANSTLVNISTKQSLWDLESAIHVVDVGANPIDGTPPYAGLLKKGMVKLVGFEPQKDALKKLLAMKGPNEIYLPHAVGTGEITKLYLCQAPGMTSTLKPNDKVLNHFQGYPVWGKVKSIEEVDTVRLDDVDEIDKIDWLKIDIQGGELNVFQNAEEKLKNTLVIQTEVNFIKLYENQPLFAEIDQWMRAHGFMLHALLEQRKRLYAPMKINDGIHYGINQLTTADAVYVRDINSLESMSLEDRKKTAFILSKAYGSYDLAYRLMMNESGFIEKEFFKKFVGKNISEISLG